MLIYILFVYCGMENLLDYGCVYLLYCAETDRVKIGSTRNVTTRFNSIATSSPSKLIIYYTSPPIQFYGKLEKAAHKKFKADRYIGEWFNSNRLDVKDFIVNGCKNSENPTIYNMFIDGDNPTKIANHFNVSRSNIVRCLLNWNMTPTRRTAPVFKVGKEHLMTFVKDVILQKNLTYGDISSQIGMSNQRISNILNNNVDPKLSEVYRLLDQLDIIIYGEQANVKE